MAKGAKHYFPDGREHKGGTHKHPDGTLMTGKVMSTTAKKLLHYGELANKAKQVARKGWK
jgi:hypothetical protein|tara:strand:+ start:364 stop:543 length:180 start_codon:yes stop_codon:yes gene_type:complete